MLSESLITLAPLDPSVHICFYCQNTQVASVIVHDYIRNACLIQLSSSIPTYDHLVNTGGRWLLVTKLVGLLPQ